MVLNVASKNNKTMTAKDHIAGRLCLLEALVDVDGSVSDMVQFLMQRLWGFFAERRGVKYEILRGDGRMMHDLLAGKYFGFVERVSPASYLIIS